MPRLIKIAVLALLSAIVVWRYALADDSTAITLSCDGTTTSLPSEKEDPVSKVGVVVNLVQRAVTFSGYTVPITKMDAASIGFGGDLKRLNYDITLNTSVEGRVDRVTGSFSATIFRGLSWTDWKLSCKPAAPLF